MPVEMTCLKAYFNIYFTTIHLQLQIINRFKHGKMEIYHLNRDLYRTFKVGNMFYYNMQSIQLFFANFIKQCNVSSSAEQKYISQMSAIDVYVQLKHEKLKSLH